MTLFEYTNNMFTKKEYKPFKGHAWHSRVQKAPPSPNKHTLEWPGWHCLFFRRHITGNAQPILPTHINYSLYKSQLWHHKFTTPPLITVYLTTPPVQSSPCITRPERSKVTCLQAFTQKLGIEFSFISSGAREQGLILRNCTHMGLNLQKILQWGF